MPKVIGEGTYGCVHKPSLKCKDKKTNPRNTISKAMLTRDAHIEMSVISDTDKKNEFHLGKPTLCNLDNTPSNMSSLSKCNNTNLIANINDVSLLIMKDGGMNLEDFSESMKHNPKHENRTETMEHFWLDMHNILVGIMKLEQNGIVHHDLKPQNIVYNMKTREMNMIDFGLMRKKDFYMNLAESSSYPYNFIHWSFPFETLYYDKINYNYISTKRKPVSWRIRIYNNLLNDFQSSTNSPDDNIINLRTFFNYIHMKHYGDEYNKNMVKKYWIDFYTFILSMKEDNYNQFLQQSLSTTDTYGLGIAISKVLSNTHMYIDTLLQNRLLGFVYKLTTPNLKKRLSPEDAVLEYEKIMDDCGLLLKYGVQYQDHKLVKIPDNIIDTVPSSVINNINSITLEDISVNKEQISRVINQKMTQCPPEKEMNPITRRCNNKCKDGMIRNDAFKCVSGLCPPYKEMNPKTRRCNKKCNPGYMRNSDFKCIKIRGNKTRKHR